MVEDKDIERWITVNGNHIPILKGQSEEDAISKFFDNKKNSDDELKSTADEDDIDIDLSVDEDVKISYKKLYYISDGSYWANPKVISEDEIDKYYKDGYHIYEVNIDDEMQEKMDDLIKEFAPSNNMLTMVNRFKDYLKFNNSELDKRDRKVVIDDFRRKALKACEKEAQKFLDKLPKSKNKSIDYALKQNANGYVESLEYQPHTTERKWYTSNCQRCIIAYEMRRRGYDVEANKYLSNSDRIYNQTLAMEKAFLDFDSSLHQKRYDKRPNGENYPSRKALIKDMEKDMLAEGEGARFVLAWDWKNCSSGHTVNAEVVNGEIKVFDSQINKTYTIQDLIDRKALKATTLECTRVDNKTLSNRLEDIIKWKK